VAICITAIVVVSTAIALAGLPGADASATKLNEQIAKSVCQFEGADAPNLRLVTPFAGDTLIRVMSGKTQYGFNPLSKRIEMAVYAGNLDGNEKVSITREEAEAIATEFAQKHCENLPVFTLHRSQLKGFDGYPDITATVMRAYDFEWVQVIDGALTPNRVFVSVNPGTGKVMTFISQYQPIESAGSPSLTKEDAKAVVAARVLETAEMAIAASTEVSKLSAEVSFSQEPELRIAVKDGKQILVWRMTADAQGDLPWVIGGQYDIDAQNGSIVAENPYL